MVKDGEIKMSKINGGLVLIDLSGKYDETNSKWVDGKASQKLKASKGVKGVIVYTDDGVYLCSFNKTEKTDKASKKYLELVTGVKSFKVYSDEVIYANSDEIEDILSGYTPIV